VLVLGSGAVTGIIGTRIIERVMPSVEQLIRDTPDPTGVEAARATEELQRYRVVTRSASLTLMGTWGVMALWTPLLLVHTRARTVFASEEPGSSSDVTLRDVSTMDEQARARAYVDAARDVDRATHPSRWF
jgi:hypothetical protein